MKILVSACLLGTPCRYDGKSIPNEDVSALLKEHELIPICPEQLGGLLTPRTPAERCGDKVCARDGRDVTKEYINGAKEALRTAQKEGCNIAILKERSPSCGNGTIYDGTFSEKLTEGDGVTAELLKQAGIRVIGESEVKKILQISK